MYLCDNNIILEDLSIRNIFIKEKKDKNDEMQVLLCDLENKELLYKGKSQNHIKIIIIII